MTKTFKHSGDLGDIIFSLPTVKALGGGVLYLDPEGGKSEPLVQHCDYGDQTKLRAKQIENIKPLLLLQPYIKDVVYWKGEKVDYNLDLFRSKVVQGKNLADFHLDAFNLPNSLRDEKWLIVDKNISVQHRPFLICRSLRYHSNHSAWVGIRNNNDIMNNSFFIGHPKEHEAFEWIFDTKIPYIETPNLLDAARLLGGCARYIGNQNVIHAIAEGLKIPTHVELYIRFPSPYFARPNADYF